jgi:hypothetical protein
MITRLRFPPLPELKTYSIRESAEIPEQKVRVITLSHMAVTGFSRSVSISTLECVNLHAEIGLEWKEVIFEGRSNVVYLEFTISHNEVNFFFVYVC